MIERVGAAVLAVFLAAGTVYAENVPERPEMHVGDLERPEVHIGDRWTYRQVDGFTSEVTADFSRRVIAVSDTEITALQEVKGTTNRKPMYFDRNWNLIDDGNANYTPSLDLVDFPLHQGDTWKHQYQGTILTSGRSVVCTVAGKALDTEIRRQLMQYNDVEIYVRADVIEWRRAGEVSDLQSIRRLNNALARAANAIDALPKRSLALSQRLAFEEQIRKGI